MLPSVMLAALAINRSALILTLPALASYRVPWSCNVPATLTSTVPPLNWLTTSLPLRTWRSAF
ncbi:hypothetical protein D3C86_1284030 [compost metagenome]